VLNDKEYPPGGTNLHDNKTNPFVFYHIQRYKETRYGALFYSLEDFKHERLSFDIVRLTDDYQRVEYTISEYGKSHTEDYIKDSVTHIQRMMKKAFDTLANMALKA
jgi:hypothetical protein